MGEENDVGAFNKRTHYRWTVLPEVPTDLLVEELLKRRGVHSKRLSSNEKFELHGPYLMICVDESVL